MRVLYIMGVGRSGSTVLDALLGNHAGAVNVGELSNLHSMGWLSTDYCACGQRAGDCAFWSAAYDHWTGGGGHERVSQYVRLQQQVEDFHRLGGTRWLKLLHGRPPSASPLARYLEQTEQLYRAVQAVSGCDVVVDSSKSPLRAVLLSRMPGLDLRILHVVRDVRGVAWSQQKQFEPDKRAGLSRRFRAESAWRSAARWTLTNRICDRVRRCFPERSALLRYEDFVDNPDQALAQIGRLADIDLSNLAERLRLDHPLHTGHAIAGNRVRMSGSIRLRADTEWRERLSHRDRQICRLVAGRPMRHYGYASDLAGDERGAA